MANLVAFGADNNFTAGDLNVQGYLAAVPAYQSCFVADGRPYNSDINDSGYHRIDMISTMLISAVTSGPFTVGESVSQATSGAVGIFLETIGSGATAQTLIYRTTPTEFVVTEVVTGATSNATVAPTAVKAPPHWLSWTLAADPVFGGTGGTFPDGGSNIMCLFEGRIFMNSVYNPNVWWATRMGNPLDLDTSLLDIQAALNSQVSLIGIVGDSIVSFIPFKDNYLLFGCANSFWILRGGTVGGGQVSNLSYETGIFGPDSWCWDNEGNLYVVGLTGFYKFPNNLAVSGVALDNISMRLIPNVFKTLQLNRRTDRVVLGFDKDTNRIHIAISTQSGSWSTCFTYDIKADSIFPDIFSGDKTPTAFIYMNSYQDEISGLLLGNYDGYIRKYDEAVKTDDGEAIVSSALFGPITASDLVRANILINEIQVLLSEDSDGLEWYLYQAQSNELIVKGIKEATLDPTHSGTFTDGGRQLSIVDRLAGESLAILFRNSTINTSWGLEAVKVRYALLGKAKE